MDEKNLHTIETPAHVEWGNTDGIPSSNETFVTGVKEDKREHSIQHVHKFFSIFFVLKRTSNQIKRNNWEEREKLIKNMKIKTEKEMKQPFFGYSIK